MPKNQVSARRRAYRSGHSGERIAAISLILSGYRVLARRYRTPVGEIDLVARRGGVLAFVEVKRRDSLASGLDAVTPRARLRIRRAAEIFLKHHPRLGELALRFDVVVVIPWRWPRHIRDAWRES